MWAKKIKSVQLWLKCKHCDVIISLKDWLIHKENNCPPNFQNWTHSFIFLENLYTTYDVFQLNDKNLELIAKDDRNNLVLMPYEMLQLCNIKIGEPVLIKTHKGDRSMQVVKIAWAKQDKTSDMVVALSNEVSDLYELEPNSKVIITKIREKVLPAKSVTLFCRNNISSSNKKSLLIKLQNQSLDKIFCIGNNLLLRHYGSKLIFEVVEISLFPEVQSNIDGFYLTTYETVWKLRDLEEEAQKNRNLIGKLGGLHDIISELKDIISSAFRKKNVSLGVPINRGILIHGPSGTGKTTLLIALAEHFTNNVVRVEGPKIFSKFIGETEKELQNLFEKAKQMSPSIIIIDDLDVLCGKSVSNLNSVSEFEKRIVATLCTQMDKLNMEINSSVVVLGATSKIHQIDKMLRRPSRFGKEIEIYVPGSLQRFEILSLLLADVSHNLSEFDLKSIADSSHGFVGADLVSLISKAVLKNYKTSGGKEIVSLNDFQWALNKVKPSTMKEIMIDVPNVRWCDIGGQEELKLKLRQCVEWPIKFKEAFTRLGITPPKGVLMFGPPGCSKTMIAKALATESKLNFISVKGPELFSKWVGESERAIRKVFRRARQSAPSIIFFDELDAIGGERNTFAGSSVQERVLAQLLTELDGVESLDNVTVIAATNRLDRIDPALIRPGRLDRIIYVPLPDRKTRQEIFRIQLSKTCAGEDVDLEELVEKTDGFSGAEIIAVCREAALKALEESLNADMIARKNFMDAFSIVVPRTSKSLLELYDKYLVK